MKRDMLFLGAYCTLIFWLSSQSTLMPIPTDFEFKDKIVHGSAYAVMAWFVWAAFSHHVRDMRGLSVVVVLFASLYGVSDEFHQSFVPGRDADVWDWFADTMGALCMSLYMYVRNLRLLCLG